MRSGVALAAILLAAAACAPNGPAISHSSPPHKASPSPSASPSASPTDVPSPTPSAAPNPTPLSVPAWATLHSSCDRPLTQNEAIMRLQGQTTIQVMDVTNALSPLELCTITGHPALTPQLVTQSMISWYATQNGANNPGQSVISVADLSTGTSTVVASWQGGGFLDGLHAWSPDRGFLAYVTSDSSGVNLHLLSGGGDRVVSTLGAIPARGVNPMDDSAYLAFSPDGAYFAFVQTLAGSGDELQVFRTEDGGVAYSLHTGTMATWGSTGSRLFFRQPGSSLVEVWNSAGGVTQAFSQQLQWISPTADAGDDDIAFTVRDSTGMPNVWLYGHSGRSGGKLPNPRSAPVWLNSTTLFYMEEAKCTANCMVGWTPDGKTFTFDAATQAETASKIAAVLSTWPRPGQV